LRDKLNLSTLENTLVKVEQEEQELRTKSVLDVPAEKEYAILDEI